jgi:hypothetical protein
MDRRRAKVKGGVSMKKTLALVLVLATLSLPTIGLAIDLSSIGLGDLQSLFGTGETGTKDKKVEIDPSDIPDGVSPEFYETMVSLEAFFDEYIEFMEKYGKANDTTSMTLDYLSFTTQYAEAMGKLEVIDEKKLTPQEDDYYAEVLLRINTKLNKYALTLD